MFEARLAVWNARRGGVTDSARLGVTQDSKVMYQMFRIILLYHNMSMQAWTGWHAWLLYPKNSIRLEMILSNERSAGQSYDSEGAWTAVKMRDLRWGPVHFLHPDVW